MSVLKSAASISVLGLLVAMPAHAQTDDGWDTATSNDTQIAYAEYSTGQTLAVQCKGTDFQIAVTGLPVVETIQKTGTIDAAFIVVDTQTRHTLVHLERDKVKHPTTGIAIMPARFARALRTGHPVTIQAEGQNDIVLAIPTDGSAVAALMSDCNIPASDENDRRQIHGLSTMDALNRAQRRNLSQYPLGNFAITTQCVVASNWKLQDCQTARQLPNTPRHDRIFSETLNGSSVKPEDGADTPLAVGDLVIFNYVSTTTTEVRPAR